MSTNPVILAVPNELVVARNAIQDQHPDGELSLDSFIAGFLLRSFVRKDPQLRKNDYCVIETNTVYQYRKEFQGVCDRASLIGTSPGCGGAGLSQIILVPSWNNRHAEIQIADWLKKRITQDGLDSRVKSKAFSNYANPARWFTDKN